MLIFSAFLIALFTSNPTTALTPDRELGSYTLTTLEEGLPQNTVLSLAHTPDGYLWMGTYEGLVRFDGLRFVVFDRRNTPALGGSNEILCLEVDERGQLWIATSESLSTLEEGQFRQVLGSRTLNGEAIRSLAMTHDGMWAGTSRRLLRLDRTGTLERSWIAGNQIPLSGIRALLADPLGGVWVGFESGKLMRLVENQINVFGENDGIPAQALLALARGRDGELWIGSEGGGLIRKYGGTVTRFGLEDGLSDVTIRSLYVDPYGVLWIGTEGGGINRFLNEQFSSLNQLNGMPSDLVRSVIGDREGGLWIGTNGGGVVSLQEKTFSSFNRKDGLRHDSVRAVMEDRSGALWIGTDGGGLHRLQGDQLTHYGPEQGLHNAFIKSLHEDRSGQLWVGTTGGGLLRFTGKRFVPYATYSGQSEDTVYVIHQDTEGAIWVGTKRGLDRIAVDGSVATIDRTQGLTRGQVTAIVDSVAGGLWVATDGGLHRVIGSSVTAMTVRDGLPSSRVFSLAEDPDGTLWIGTNRGLSRHRNGAFQTINSRQGLFDDVVFSILDDGKGQVWMSSNRGIFSVSRDDLTDVLDGRVESLESTHYGRENGIETDQCNGLSQPSSWQTRDGRLLFPTVHGVAILDPALIMPNMMAPPVVIEELEIDGKKVDLQEKILLEPGQGERLAFRYTGLSLHSPDQVSFRYQLVGFDGDWVAAGTRRVAYYTKIPPGNYRFQVIAANQDGVWNEKGDSIGVVIKPFFYQTRWFPGALAIAVLALVWWSHRWRLSRIQAHNQELATMVAKRTSQLADANRMLRRLAESDGLTGVANRRRFDEVMAEEWKRACRQKTPLSLLMIDLDFFKQYNDTYGHQEGDEVLMQVAAKLQDSARRVGDLVARYGGEEFAIVIPAIGPEEAERYAERMRQKIEEVAIPHGSSSIGDRVTVSVGVATHRPWKGGSVEELILHADQALYRAKHSGRNQIARAQDENLSSPFSRKPK